MFIYIIYDILKNEGFMGFIYMSEFCDIISTLGTPKIFTSPPFLETMMRTSTSILVRLKGDGIGNKCVLKKKLKN